MCAVERVRSTADDRRVTRVEASDVSAQPPGCAVEMHCCKESAAESVMKHQKAAGLNARRANVTRRIVWSRDWAGAMVAEPVLPC